MIVMSHFTMLLGGNQRDLARAKNMKKQQDANKNKDDGLTPQQRRERYERKTLPLEEIQVVILILTARHFVHYRDAARLAEKIKQKESKTTDNGNKN
jgi:hypothetical protein